MHFFLFLCLYAFISLLLYSPSPSRIMRLDLKVSVYETRYVC